MGFKLISWESRAGGGGEFQLKNFRGFSRENPKYPQDLTKGFITHVHLNI